MNQKVLKDHFIVVSMGDPAGVGWPVLIRLLSEESPEKKNTSVKASRKTFKI